MKDFDLDKIKKIAKTGDIRTDLARRTVVANGIYFSSEDRGFSRNLPQTWNLELETSNIKDQKGAGLCWLFAELNQIRHQVESAKKIKNMDFSETFNFFYDKLEKSNAFLDLVWKFRKSSLSSRENCFIFDHPQGDGGWATLADNLIDKYGLVPQNVMPESENTRMTRNLDNVLTRILRRGGIKIREISSEADFIAQKNEILADVYRVLSISLGEPPKKFSWSYRDDKKKIKKFSGTPKEFANWLGVGKLSKKHVQIQDIPTLEYGKMYQEKHARLMSGEQLPYLNLPISEIKPLILTQLKRGEGVTADIASSRDMTTKNQGVMDEKVYDLDNLFGVKFDISRKDVVRSHEDLADHDVLIVGADVSRGAAKWYKIENSWGTKVGNDGFWAMSDSWADEHLSGVVLNSEYLPENIKKMLDDEPISLEWWEEYGE